MKIPSNNINALRILIVEDDLSFALELEMLLKNIGYSVINRVDNSAAALEMIYAKKPDFILMDVDIKGQLTGIELGRNIKHLEIPILFITSFGDEATYQAAQESKIIGYLVKPVNKFSLKSAIRLALENSFLRQNHPSNKQIIDSQSSANFFIKDAFFFKKKDLYFKVNINEITYIESDDKYSITHTTRGEKFMARVPISQMEQSLSSKDFLRIHRSCIVSINKITSVNFFEGTLQIGTNQLPISRTKQKELQEMMQRMS